MSNSTKRVAVVTGSNKGIGFAVVRALCKQFQGDVVLTARNEANGAAAIKQLNDEGLKPKFHQLDITDRASIERIKSFLETNYGGLDVLVNNAGIAFKGTATEPFSEQAEVTMRCNFWGTLDASNILFPLLRPHARVVNVSSMASQFAARKCSETLRARFLAQNLTMKDVEQLMTEFVDLAKDGTFKEKGWADSGYGVSKIGVTLMSNIQQKSFNNDSREDLVVNSCCPGFVDTDLTSHKGTRTVEEGADVLIYLALLPPNISSPKGEFVSDREVKTWP